MDEIYEDLAGIGGELEADVMILESVILNGKNRRANKYIQEAIYEIQRALSCLSVHGV